MTDKEKEAIRVLNEDLKLAKEEDSIDIDVLTGNLEIALNLIEKQQAEIEKKDRQLEERTNRIRNLERECQKHFDNMMEVIQENSKKDIMIDMLLDKIAFNYNINSYEDVKTIKQQVKEEIERKVEK